MNRCRRIGPAEQHPASAAAALREAAGIGFLEVHKDHDDARRARLTVTEAGADVVAVGARSAASGP